MRSDRLVITALIFAVALLSAAFGLDWLGGALGILSRWLNSIPAPTDSWATIVNSLAWPAVTVFLVARYRGHLKSFFDTLAERLRTDHLKLGPFEITPNSEVIAMDPNDVDESTDDYAPEDIQRIEELFEFISETANLHKLAVWVNENVEDELEVGDFLTSPDYGTQREMAHRVMFEGKK